MQACKNFQIGKQIISYAGPVQGQPTPYIPT
jgi:hypothetical protein